MLGTFLDKAEGLLNRRFVVAYWLPTFFAAVVAALFRVWAAGFKTAWRWWQKLVVDDDNSAQIWLLLAFLLGVTLIAYLLQAFTRTLIEVYEGYRLWPDFLRRWRVKHHRRKLAAFKAESLSGPARERAQAYDKLFYGFPLKADQVLPTRLGNAIRAAERYGIRTYGMDMPFWWPRLWAKLPEAEQTQVEDALSTLVALLNLATLFAAVGLFGVIYLPLTLAPPARWWSLLADLLPRLLAGLGAWLVAWLGYQGAVVQARSYGQHLRTAVDLHRFGLLQALHQPLSKTLLEEKALWAWLTAWLYGSDPRTAFAKPYDHGGGAEEDEAPEEPPAKPESFWARLWRVIRT
jgi:hypothetical protein